MPSPRLKATVDEAQLAELCADLNITIPRVTINPGRHPDGRYGDYCQATYTIRLFLEGGRGEATFDNLAAAQRELVRTFLHELRHHWQRQYHPEWGNVQCEADAEAWCQRKVASHRTIVRLSRSFPNSGFSRMNRRVARRGM